MAHLVRIQAPWDSRVPPAASPRPWRRTPAPPGGTPRYRRPARSWSAGWRPRSGLPASIWILAGAAGHGAFAHRMVDHRAVKGPERPFRLPPRLLSQLDHDVLGQGAVNLIVGVGGMQVPCPGPVGAEEITVLDISAPQDESEGIVPEPGLVGNRGLPKPSGHRRVLPDLTQIPVVHHAGGQGLVVGASRPKDRRFRRNRRTGNPRTGSPGRA